MKKTALLLAILLACGAASFGCSNTDAEDVGESIDEGVEETGDEIDDAT